MKEKKLGFGMMRLPLLNAEDQKSIDFEQVNQMVDTFIERGFTYFDTAYMYHSYESENVVREAVVKRHPRKTFTIATKLPVMQLKQEADVERIFNEQLEKTGAGYFDYYLLHNLTAMHYETAEKFHAFEFVQEKKAAGIIKNVGFSFHDKADVLDRILTAHPEVDFVQLQINYLDWESEEIQSRKCYETAVKHQKKVVIMEPVKGGTLAGMPDKAADIFKAIHPEMSVSSWAIRYAASLENVMMVLSGMSDMQQLLDNTGYMQEFKPVDEEERKAIEQVVEVLSGENMIPCTSCRYCVEGCPKKIAIPDYFSLYNAKKQAGDSSQNTQYEELVKANGKPSDCIDCKKCEKSCPQHLRIREYLKLVTAAFE